MQNHDLLVEATLGNLNWCGERFTREDTTDSPEFFRYTRLHPEHGDFGLVTERGHSLAGVVWLQFHSATDPGYGFVNEETPELSIWVRDTERGRGFGRMLLRAAILEARKRKLSAVSLSVESGNPARQLYASEGFTDVPGLEADRVMLWTDTVRQQT